MANAALKNVGTRRTGTPQTKRAREDQIKNDAGGYVFQLSDLDAFKRFLIFGSEKNFYSAAEKQAQFSADLTKKLIAAGKSREVVDTIVSISTEGRAAKQQPGLFALAVASSFGTDEDKSYALSKVPAVARTASTLFTFVAYLDGFRGFGRGVRRALAGWYEQRDLDKLAYQIVKYKERDGFSHKRIIDLSHPSRSKSDEQFSALMDYARERKVDEAQLPHIVLGVEAAKTASEKDLPRIIQDFGLSWEMIPTEALTKKATWEALLNGGSLPLGALIRQLSRLTKVGVIKPLSTDSKAIAERIVDEEQLRRARIHPLNLLIASRAYARGYATRGGRANYDDRWTPDNSILEALDTAFYKSFKFVEPTGKRYFQAVDISGSMSTEIGGGGFGAGLGITAREAALVLSMVTERTEPMTFLAGFNHTLTPFTLGKNTRLDQIREPSWSGGNTDAAAPMLYALANQIEADVFTVYTDNQTWAGSMQPFEALRKYRRETGIDAKLIVLGMTVNNFSIADPRDPGMLDIAGFDTNVPQVMNEFVRG